MLTHANVSDFISSTLRWSRRHTEGGRPIKWLTFAAALLTVLALTVAAAGQAPIQQGSRELLGSFAWATASYTYDDEDVYSQAALSLAPGFGYFVADGTELRFMLPITFWSVDYGDYGRGSRSEYGPLMAFLFHFGGTESFVPYAGAGVGASWASDSNDGDYETLWILPSLHVAFAPSSPRAPVSLPSSSISASPTPYITRTCQRTSSV